MEGDRELRDYRMSIVEWTSMVPGGINTMLGMATTAGCLYFVCRTQKPNSGNQVRMSLYTRMQWDMPHTQEAVALLFFCHLVTSTGTCAPDDDDWKRTSEWTLSAR